jgi:hypothetical protein
VRQRAREERARRRREEREGIRSLEGIRQGQDRFSSGLVINKKREKRELEKKDENHKLK